MSSILTDQFCRIWIGGMSKANAGATRTQARNTEGQLASDPGSGANPLIPIDVGAANANRLLTQVGSSLGGIPIDG